MPYCNEDNAPTDPIYVTYGKNIDQKFQQQPITVDEAYQLKVRNNIETTFDEAKIVDDIDDGKDSKDNYSGVYLDLINLEIKKRQEPKYPEFKTSRYAYYKEKKVNEYFSFLKNKFYSTHEYITPEPYGIDSNYFEISQGDNIVMLKTEDTNADTARYYLTTREMAKG